MIVPKWCILEGFRDYCDRAQGIYLAELSPFQVIRAQTKNSEYWIFPINPLRGEVLVQGGAYFTQPSEALFNGSSFGGCMMKIGWIGLGMRMEICAAGKRIVTTPVRSFIVEELGWFQPKN